MRDFDNYHKAKKLFFCGEAFFGDFFFGDFFFGDFTLLEGTVQLTLVFG